MVGEGHIGSARGGPSLHLRSHSIDIVSAALDLVNVLDAGDPELVGTTQQAAGTRDAEWVLECAQSVFGRFSRWNRPFGLDEVHAVRNIAFVTRTVGESLVDGRVDEGVEMLNSVLADRSFVLHISPSDPWDLHFHDPEAPAAQAWGDGVYTALAMVISFNEWRRIGRCNAEDCGRLYFDGTKNRSRRFCSQACRNRTKVREYRRRLRASG
jgi:predicted RNA-binding Zn ribbon-like protein